MISFALHSHSFQAICQVVKTVHFLMASAGISFASHRTKPLTKQLPKYPLYDKSIGIKAADIFSANPHHCVDFSFQLYSDVQKIVPRPATIGKQLI